MAFLGGHFFHKFLKFFVLTMSDESDIDPGIVDSDSGKELSAPASSENSRSNESGSETQILRTFGCR